MSSAVSDVRSCLCLQARRAARHLTQVYDDALRPSGLKVTQFQLLAAISEAEPVTQQLLSELLGIDRTTLTRNLALLQRGGLIEIAVGHEDRREHHHRLTSKGRSAVKRAMPLWRSIHEELVERVGTGRRGSSFNNADSVLRNLIGFREEQEKSESSF